MRSKELYEWIDFVTYKMMTKKLARIDLFKKLFSWPASGPKISAKVMSAPGRKKNFLKKL